MSTFAATIEQLEILPHPNADKLELARIGQYRCVVEKDKYKSGDYALYIPEAAILPEDLIEELGLIGRLSGSEQNRVKAIKLRGQVSQGIVCRPQKLMRLLDFAPLHSHEGEDFAEPLGIAKWVPPIPTHLSGQVIPSPDLVKWCEIENIKRYPNLFVRGEEVVVSEKIHGTCLLMTYTPANDTIMVSSKGLGSRSLALDQNNNNVYWRAVHKYGLDKALVQMAHDFDFSRIALFGEVYGKGIQDLDYEVQAGVDGPGFGGFDLWTQDDHDYGYVDFNDALSLMDNYDIPTVPVFFEGEYDYDFINTLASGKEEVSGSACHMREGVVVRPLKETISNVTGSRKIAKFISDEYLLRKDGSEYE